MAILEERPCTKKRIRIYNMTTYMRHQILLNEDVELTFDMTEGPPDSTPASCPDQSRSN